MVRRNGLWFALFGALLAAPCVAEASTCTWTGLAVDNNWSSAGNWDGCAGAHPTPQAGDILVFPPGTPRPNPVNDLVDLSVAGVQITGAPAPGGHYVIYGNALRLAGELRFSGPPNSVSGTGPQLEATLVLDGASVISNFGTGVAYLQAIDVNGAPLTFAPDTQSIAVLGTISGAGAITKQASNRLQLYGANTFTGPLQIAAGVVALGNYTQSALGSPAGGTTVAAGATLVMEGFSESADPLTLDGGTLTGNGANYEYTEMKWNGPVTVAANSIIHTLNSCRLYLVGAISGSATLTISGRVTVRGTSPSFTGETVVSGDLVVDRGSLANSAITVTSTGVLAGGGTLGGVVSTGGRLQPYGGFFEGLQTGGLTLHAGTRLETRVSEPNGDRPPLSVTGTVTVANATLDLELYDLSTQNHVVTLVENDGVDPIVGTFAGLPEGATISLGIPSFPVLVVVSYQGGTGNDVTLTVKVPTWYYLSEGATGSFFDEDILIANPNTVEAPVTLTFLTTGGVPIVQERTLPAQSRTTIHVDQIPGLAEAEVSTVVKSPTPGLSLAVERSMFWDQTYYAGHTGGSTAFPAQDWYFAEGSQGFFRTYLQLANPDTTYPAPTTVTFLRENAPPIERKFTIAPNARLTVDCSTIDELANSSFAIHVFAIGHIIAERAMYFGTTPERVFSGGHESVGTRPASSWFFAEGATGDFFDTFLLFGNAGTTDATVTLKYLLDTGETVTRTKTVPAQARLTVNVGQEDDPRLHHAAVSTLVTSDVPIVAERSMYWGRGESFWREGHNSFGVTESRLHWGVAEGRIGGPLNFRTYIQIANPQTDAAEVTVTFLREAGSPIVKTYTVPPTSRFNIDVAEVDPAMHDESVGADIRVTNGMRIVVERSMYWDSGGVFFKGGTNATAVPLP